MNQKKSIASAGAALGLAVMLSGCVSAYPERDLRFGQAVMAAREAQTLNPEAGRTRDPNAVPGVAGAAAGESYKRYLDSFKEPPKTINIFNIGGGISN